MTCAMHLPACPVYQQPHIPWEGSVGHPRACSHPADPPMASTGLGDAGRGVCQPAPRATTGTAAVPRLCGGKLSLIRSVVTMAMAVIRLEVTQMAASPN